MIIVGICYFIMIIVAVIIAMSTMGSMMSGLNEDFSGEDIRGIFETARSAAFISIVPNILLAVAYAMVLFKPAKSWGRPMLGVFIGLAVLSSIGGAFISYTLTGDLIDEIDPDREDYTADDVTSFQQDATMNGWIAGLVRLPEYIIYLIVAIGAFMNVKKMEEELQPKMDSRLHNIRL